MFDLVEVSRLAMMQGRLASFTEARYAQLDTPIILIWHSR
jgi:hypothetical protein